MILKNSEQKSEKIVVGQQDIVDQLLISLFSRGHCILVGVPGLAKTLLIRTLSQSLSLSFNRIQFTPDLMPGDITGTEIIEEDPSSGKKMFRFIPGPLFANIILADEINRTPPKTQAALLESMQEYHVTARGTRHDLEKPFFVLATQNPIEQEAPIPCPKPSWTGSCSISGLIILHFRKSSISSARQPHPGMSQSTPCSMLIKSSNTSSW